MRSRLATLLTVIGLAGIAAAEDRPDLEAQRAPAVEELLAGRFRWVATGPLVAPAARPEDPCHAVKDPTIVRSRDRWHLFCTIRSRTARTRSSTSRSPTGRTPIAPNAMS